MNLLQVQVPVQYKCKYNRAHARAKTFAHFSRICFKTKNRFITILRVQECARHHFKMRRLPRLIIYRDEPPTNHQAQCAVPYGRIVTAVLSLDA